MPDNCHNFILILLRQLNNVYVQLYINYLPPGNEH